MLDRDEERHRWEAYFYPETLTDDPASGTLRNRWGIRNPERLQMLERAATAFREQQLYHREVTIEHTFGLDHLRAIHRHLFQDAYDWAGEIRNVEMRKMRDESPAMVNEPKVRRFASPHDDEIPRLVGNVQDLLKDIDLSKVGPSKLALIGAGVYAYLNEAHAFREGNGRTGQRFLNDIATHTAFRFDFAKISPAAWNQASVLSAPRPGRQIEPRPFLAMLQQIVVPAHQDTGQAKTALRVAPEMPPSWMRGPTSDTSPEIS